MENIVYQTKVKPIGSESLAPLIFFCGGGQMQFIISNSSHTVERHLHVKQS